MLIHSLFISLFFSWLHYERFDIWVGRERCCAGGWGTDVTPVYSEGGERFTLLHQTLQHRLAPSLHLLRLRKYCAREAHLLFLECQTSKDIYVYMQTHSVLQWPWQSMNLNRKPVMWIIAGCLHAQSYNIKDLKMFCVEELQEDITGRQSVLLFPREGLTN